ncbi:PQQ-binding-like beta-propeller repeat protein [Planctomycetota bacterium]
MIGALLLVGAAAGSVAAGEVAGRLIASPEPGWPQWRGPRRDGICDEKGLLQSWPEGGPTRLWTASGLGRGYSSPVISGERMFLTGDVGAELHVFALDLEGKALWRAKNGQAWRKNFRGARASCCYSNGYVYHMNALGRVACFDAATGKEEWAVNVCERFGGRPIFWGLSECLLVDGPRVVVTPGGTKALMAALDKKTGETAWASEPLMLDLTTKFGGAKLPQPRRVADQAGYASPILLELSGRRHIVSCSLRHTYGVDADTGKLLWTHPMPTRWEALVMTPVLWRDCVFVTGPDGKGGVLLRIRDEGQKVSVEQVWTSDLDTLQGGDVAVGDRLYGSWYRHFDGWGCVDLRTGKTLYRTKELAMGSAVWADGRLYALSQRGEMALLKPTPQGFEFAGRFRLVEQQRKDVWPHPVILDGRLYLRYHDKLHCYDIKAK